VVSAPPVVVAPLLIALGAAVASLVTRRWGRLQRAVSLAGGLAYLGAVAVLFRRVAVEGTLTYQVGKWQAPYGISLVADSLATFMLGLSAVVSVAALTFSVLYVDDDEQRLSYHALYHMMMTGVTGSFLTGDLFNLFVWFEVMLMASYVLVVFYGGSEHTRAALQYAVLNLVGGALMLVAVGGLYGVTGTLNMAQMSERLAAAPPGVATLPALGLTAVLFAVFALKTGLVPFQWWAPAAYSAAPAPVAAMLAAVVKKVGVYAIVRLYFTVFAGLSIPGGLALPGFEGTGLLGFYGPVLFLMAAASIVLGGVGAVAHHDLDQVLAYSSIGQIGFVVLPLAVAATVPPTATAAVPGLADPLPLRTLGVAAALVYALNHAVAKGGLYLASGAVDSLTGTTDLRRLGGLTGAVPTLSAGVFVGGLGLIGIPPLSGFFAKFLVFDTAARAATASGPLGLAGPELALATALAGATLTIAYVTRMWNRGFWGATGDAVERLDPATGQIAVALALSAGVLAIGLAFDPVFEAAVDAAEAAVDAEGYVEAVDPESEVRTE
jgi:multicomponent Na+:H+ antiporter subunit D